MRALWLPLTTLGLIVLGTPGWASDAATPVTSEADFLPGAAVLGPLGLNPLLTLSALGAARFSGVGHAPPGLEFFEHPVVFIALLACAILLMVGKSSKLSKPFAEAAGLGEGFVALAAAVLIALPHFAKSTPEVSGTAPVEAGVGGGLLLIGAGLTATLVIIVVRSALSVMVWLSPFPFVDGAFEFLKLLLTLGLILLALFAPGLALIVNVALLVITLMVLRWAVRAARFGITILYDLSIGRFGERCPLPVDAVAPEDLGPFDVFVLDVPGLKRRASATLTLDAGRWFLEAPRAASTPQRIPLGDGHLATFTRRIAGLELSLPTGRVLLPPRYRHLADSLAEHSGGELTAPQATLRMRPRPVRQAI